MNKGSNQNLFDLCLRCAWIFLKPNKNTLSFGEATEKVPSEYLEKVVGVTNSLRPFFLAQDHLERLILGHFKCFCGIIIVSNYLWGTL